MPIRGLPLKPGSKIRVMIGIRVFIGEISNIDDYGNILLTDVKGNPITFRPKDAKFIQIISDSDYDNIRQRYQ
jgi:small nuclear ribonucleoprotein (snRNP)-like protein